MSSTATSATATGIDEFNRENDAMKLAFPYRLLDDEIKQTWRYQVGPGLLFNHADYNTFSPDTDQRGARRTGSLVRSALSA